MVGFSDDVTESAAARPIAGGSEEELEYLRARARSSTRRWTSPPSSAARRACRAVHRRRLHGRSARGRRDDRAFRAGRRRGAVDAGGLHPASAPPDRSRGCSPDRASDAVGEPQLPEQIQAEDRTPWPPARRTARICAASPAGHPRDGTFLKSGERLSGTSSIALMEGKAGVRAAQGGARRRAPRGDRERASVRGARLHRRDAAEEPPPHQPARASSWRRSTSPRRAAPRSAATSTTCSRPAAEAGGPRRPTLPARAWRRPPSRRWRATRCAPRRCRVAVAPMLETVDDALLRNFRWSQLAAPSRWASSRAARRACWAPRSAGTRAP